VNQARPGEVAGTSLAYRTVSDQKVNSTRCSGEDWATTPRITRIPAYPPDFVSYSENEPAPSASLPEGCWSPID